MSLQHDLVAKVAKAKLTYITLTKVKQSHVKKEQFLTIHCVIAEIKGTGVLWKVFSQRGINN